MKLTRLYASWDPLTIMKFLTEVERFVNLTERLAPRCRRSKLWQRARNNVLREAWWVQMDLPWEEDDEPENMNKLFIGYMKSKGREIEDGGFEDDELEEDESEYYSDAMLEEALGMPLLKRQ